MNEPAESPLEAEAEAEAAGPRADADVAPAPAPEPAGTAAPRPYDLPSARRVVVSGLVLLSISNRELRQASVYIGLLTLGLLGPTLVYGVAIAGRLTSADLDLVSLFEGNSPEAGPILAFLLFIYAAIIGLFAVTIDGQLIAIALLAARAGQRTLSLREATTRARQVFWRMVRGAIMVGLANGVLQAVVRALLGDAAGVHEATTTVALVVGTIVLAPLGYLATAVVLGDVGAIEGLRRSVRLTRARPGIALVVALFTLLTSAIQVFALSAGLGLLVDVGRYLDLGVGATGIALVAVVVGLFAFVMAFGSLLFTVAAIVAAPQVTAFLGLTFYSGGLDRALDPGLARFHWVAWPMALLMVLLAIGSVAGIALLP